MRREGGFMEFDYRRVTALAVAALALTAARPAWAATRTVCPGCTFTRIQNAINASVAGDTVQVNSTYDSVAAGEVFPVQTLAVTGGALTITGQVDGSGNPTTKVKFRNGG